MSSRQVAEGPLRSWELVLVQRERLRANVVKGARFVTSKESKADTKPVTLAEIRESWPATVDVTQAARAFRLSRSHAYSLAKRGKFPATVIKVGERYSVVTESIIRLLSGYTVDPPQSGTGRATAIQSPADG